jgi:GTP-binding protein
MTGKTHNSDCQIKNVQFIKGITGNDPILEEDRPHIVVAGRSNAGKSSVINRLLTQEVAHTSRKPGKTQEINFFSIDNAAYLVDLPGYGYAKVSARRAEKLRKQMLWYLVRSGAPIKLLLLVLDVRRGCKGLDRDLLDIASGEGFSVVIVANKVDKCNQKERVAALRELEEDVTSQPQSVKQLFPFSAVKGTGREELCAIIKATYAN